MTLRYLLRGIAEAPDIAIEDIAMDSRAVRPGALFIAVAGGGAHGIDFVADALSAGAVAVVTDLPADDRRLRSLPVPVVSIAGDAHLPALLAARFFGAPSAQLQVFAVTGTNGKSSISWLLASALGKRERPAAMMGTLGFGAPDALREQRLTTPDPVTVQRQLATLADEGFGAVALEASSHALRQARLAHVAIDVAVFSNLSRDHLDYHASMEDYFEAKAALFASEPLGARVIGVDDDWGRRLYRRYADDAIAVATTAGPEAAQRFVTVTERRVSAAGIELALDSHAGSARIRSPLIGAFHVQNLALAFGALLAAGLAPAAAATALSGVAAVPGRMQRIGEARPAVFVDFAHTEDALAAALDSLRPLTTGALWCVFGCGGDRDRGKRAAMAAVVEALADRLVLTSDNPRSESPHAIIRDMQAGLRERDVIVEPDRRRAIRHAIDSARLDDAVLIAGKGHETTQEIDGRLLPFDDAREARLALRDRAKRGV